jgi:hypothetical protein
MNLPQWPGGIQRRCRGQFGCIFLYEIPIAIVGRVNKREYNMIIYIHINRHPFQNPVFVFLHNTGEALVFDQSGFQTSFYALHIHLCLESKNGENVTI